jgi:hypothetical protein
MRRQSRQGDDDISGPGVRGAQRFGTRDSSGGMGQNPRSPGHGAGVAAKPGSPGQTPTHGTNPGFASPHFGPVRMDSASRRDSPGESSTGQACRTIDTTKHRRVMESPLMASQCFGTDLLLIQLHLMKRCT